MGISERKEREKFEMRKNIIDVATTMFIEDGYENTSIRKIAEKIEYSPATLYLYYKDKDELLYDVQAECFSRLVAFIQQEVKSDDPLQQLREISRAYVTFGLKNPQLYDLMFIIKSPMNACEDEETWANAESAFGTLVGCVQRCMENGLISFDSVMTASLSIWAMGHGLISLQTRCRMQVTGMTDEMVEQSIHTCIIGYLNQITVKQPTAKQAEILY